MRRSIPALATALGLSLALAGCSGGGGEAATGDESTKPAESAGTLTVWVDDTRSGPVKKVAETFEADTGVTVKFVQTDFGKIRDDFISQVPTGQGPDIIVGAHDWLGKLVQNGVVAPIELGDKAGDFLDVSVEAMSYEGTLYGLPYSVENIGLVRNNALVTEPTPDTFDALVEQAKAVGTEHSVLIQQDETDGDPYHLYPLQTSFGAPVFAQDDTGAYDGSQLAMDTEQGRAFAAYVGKLGAEGVLKTTVSGDIAKEAFLQGTAPYMITGPWNAGDFVDAGHGRVDRGHPVGRRRRVAAVRGRAGLLHLGQERERAARERVRRELPGHRGRAARALRGRRPCARAERRGRHDRRRPGRGGLRRGRQERRADAVHPRDGLRLVRLGRHAGGDHQPAGRPGRALDADVRVHRREDRRGLTGPAGRAAHPPPARHTLVGPFSVERA
jgi:hypothetical protein